MPNIWKCLESANLDKLLSSQITCILCIWNYWSKLESNLDNYYHQLLQFLAYFGEGAFNSYLFIIMTNFFSQGPLKRSRAECYQYRNGQP